MRVAICHIELMLCKAILNTPHWSQQIPDDLRLCYGSQLLCFDAHVTTYVLVLLRRSQYCCDERQCCVTSFIVATSPAETFLARIYCAVKHSSAHFYFDRQADSGVLRVDWEAYRGHRHGECWPHSWTTEPACLFSMLLHRSFLSRLYYPKLEILISSPASAIYSPPSRVFLCLAVHIAYYIAPSALIFCFSLLYFHHLFSIFSSKYCTCNKFQLISS